MSLEKIKYSIVIPTYNHLEDLLKPCIESIYKNTDMSQVELIVSANGCTDGTQEYVKGLKGNVVLIDTPEQLGYTRATNLGIKKAKGEYVVLLNNDCQILDFAPKNFWLEKLMSPFVEERRMGVTGVSMGYSMETNDHFLIFFCVMIKREIFDIVGLLDEQIGTGIGGGEDVDFCIRVKRAGYKCRSVIRAKGITEDGKKVGAFPLYHVGEGTFHDDKHKTMWSFHAPKVDRILYQKWKINFEPRETAVLIFSKGNDEGVKEVVSDCFEFLNMGKTKVIPVIDSPSEDIKEHVEELGLPVSPVYTENATYSEMLKEGWKKVDTKFVVLIDANSRFKKQPVGELIAKSKDFLLSYEGQGCSTIKYSFADIFDYIPFDFSIVCKSLIEKVGGFAPRAIDSLTDLGFYYSFKLYERGFLVEAMKGYDGVNIKPSQLSPSVVSLIEEQLNSHFSKVFHIAKSGLPYIRKNTKIPIEISDKWMFFQDRIYGNKILEINCGTGYGKRFLWKVKDICYLGVDSNVEALGAAVEDFSDNYYKYEYREDPYEIEEEYDTIIVSHNASFDRVRELKDKCKKLLCCFSVGEEVKEGEFDEVLQKEKQILCSWGKERKHKSFFIHANKGSGRVAVLISTRGRNETTLPLCLNAVLNQQKLPTKVIIYDDNENLTDYMGNELYRGILQTFSLKGVEWFICPGKKQGQVANYQDFLEKARKEDFEFVWIIGDDCCPEPNVLGKLLENFKDEKVGAVNGLILPFGSKTPCPLLASNKLEDILRFPNIQWFVHNDISPIEVDHLYGGCLYRTIAALDYETKLSRAGHREETIFSYQIKRNVWKVLVDRSVITWHYHLSTGGIRDSKIKKEDFEHDERIFKEKCKEWGVELKSPPFYVVLNGGIGDHFVFKNVLPEVKKKHKEIVIACCYRDVFNGEDSIKFISLEDAKNIGINIDEFNIYGFMRKRGWKGHIIEAYKHLYGVVHE